jgi:hypothetical protein
MTTTRLCSTGFLLSARLGTLPLEVGFKSNGLSKSDVRGIGDRPVTSHSADLGTRWHKDQGEFASATTHNGMNSLPTIPT